MANKNADDEMDAMGTNVHTTNRSFILQKIAECENALKITKPITQTPSEIMFEYGSSTVFQNTGRLTASTS